MPRNLFLAAVLACLSPLAAPRAQERPLVLPLPPAVRMTDLAVAATVVDGVATTTLRQTWRNDGAAEAEATWVLPLPEGAVADGFTLTVNGVPTSGEVLDAASARSVYEGIVRSRRDPGLLEWLGRGCLRARIFPIAARGESRVEVLFRQVLPERLGLRRWSLALGAAGSGGLAPERVVLDLSIRSRRPIRNAFSPLAALRVTQKDEREVRASFEGSPASLPERELAVLYGLSEAEFGLDLLAHRSPGSDEGTFLLLVSPKRDWHSADAPKRAVTFVLDTSGSMEGEKMEQARAALRLFLGSLRPDDRFEVVPFSTEPEPFFGERVPATSERVAEALARVERLTAAGGTNIDGALAAALRGGDAPDGDGRVPLVVFLTDGEPTVGVTDPAAILAAARSANVGRARVFVLGVGASLDTRLLDTLAAENGGARDYVRAGERIDDKTRALLEKLSRPVMTDLALSIDGIATSKLVPAKLPDLFAGERLELFGRYAGDGARAIRLSGVVGGARREIVYEATFPRETGAEHAFLAPLWAERRVGVLLDAIRLNGPGGPNAELVAEVQRLGREYRIVTPYTSHLVLEPGMRVAGTGITRPGAEMEILDALGYGGGDGFVAGGPATPGADALAEDLVRAGVLGADAPRAALEELAFEIGRDSQASKRRLEELGRESAGERAVEDSVFLAQLSSRGDATPGRSALERLTRRVHDKVFVLRGGAWVDQACDGAPCAARTVVEAYSDEYFALLAARPALAPYLALGSRVVVRLGDAVFEVTERG